MVYLVSSQDLTLEERKLEIFKLKKQSTFISWMNYAESYMCASTSLTTLLVATTLESDYSLYTAMNNSDGYKNAELHETVTYQNRYGLKILEDAMNFTLPKVKNTVFANRRFTTIEDTRLVFTEALHKMNDRLTVFFIKNQTEKRLATIQCLGTQSKKMSQILEKVHKDGGVKAKIKIVYISN